MMTTHVAVGATIGLAVQQPVLGFALGMCSHFLLDMIPHGDSALGEKHFGGAKKSLGPYVYITLDNVIAIYLLLALVNIAPKSALLALSLGVSGSILPDVFVGVHEASRHRLLRGFFAWHMKIHNLFTSRVGDMPLLAGIAYQAAFIVFLFTIVQ